MTRRFGAVLVGLAVVGLSSPAFAEPTLWQRVTRPEVRAEAKLAAQLERMLDDATRGGMFELGLDREFSRGAVAMIELSGLTEPSDPRLAVLEARALIEADIGREADARRLLEGALERLPPGSRAASAWNLLATALAHLGDPKAQHRAYTRVIELTWDPEIRAVSLYNRGEVSMFQRNLVAARDDYENAVAEARELSLVALARYGLAVAEERLGDLPKAYAVLDKVAFVALPVPPFAAEDPLDLPGTTFEPPYEENYIRALRAMAIGRRSTDPEERHDAFEIAVIEWDTYLARAPDADPYRAGVERHRARAERERDRPPRPASH